MKSTSRTNDKPIKDAIQQLLVSYQLKRKFDETQLIAKWPELMGVAIANRTKKLYIHDKKLFIQIESSVIRNELLMMRSKIIESLNEFAQATVIEDVVLI